MEKELDAVFSGSIEDAIGPFYVGVFGMMQRDICKPSQFLGVWARGFLGVWARGRIAIVYMVFI